MEYWDYFSGKKREEFLPPLPVPARLRIENPNLHLLRIGELIKLHVPVAKDHVETAFAFVIVPDALFVGIATVCMPGPVALDDFVRRAKGEFGGLDGEILVGTARGAGVTHDMARAERVVLPLRQITRAVAQVAILYVGAIEEIAFVIRTAEDFVSLRVFVQRAIRGCHENAVSAVRPPGGVPVQRLRKGLVVVVSVHQHGKTDLFLVAGALDLRGLLFRSAQRGQQHARKDRDYSDHDEKLDEREAASSEKSRSFHRIID